MKIHCGKAIARQEGFHPACFKGILMISTFRKAKSKIMDAFLIAHV